MTASTPTLGAPPEAGIQFDIGSTDDSLERMTELFAQLGDTYRVYAPGRKSYTYVINHPDDVKRVLVGNHRNYTKGVGLDRVKILLGNGIMTSEGELWRRQRAMLQPLFHRRVITQFAQVIAAANDRFIERWEAQARRGELVNVTDDMSELTLDVVLRSTAWPSSSAAIPSRSSLGSRRATCSSPTSSARWRGSSVSSSRVAAPPPRSTSTTSRCS